MVYCNVADILDHALNKVQDNSPELRSKALSWLNSVALDISTQPRTWKFLETVDVISPAYDGTYSLPADFNELLYLKTDDFYYTKEDQLTDDEVEVYNVADSSVTGYTLDGNLITFIPTDSVTTDVTIKYERMIQIDLLDNSYNTIYPSIFKNLFITGVRMHYYDYDKDGRYGKEVVLYQDEMDKVKAWDNRLKTIPKFTRHGYLR